MLVTLKPATLNKAPSGAVSSEFTPKTFDEVRQLQAKLAAPTPTPENSPSGASTDDLATRKNGNSPTNLDDLDINNDVKDVYQLLGGKNYLRMLAVSKPQEFIKLLQMAARNDIDESNKPPAPVATDKPAILRITNFAT